MKVYISVDMEGLAGITAPFQEKEEVASFRRALHNQIRWIVDGIHESTVNGQIEEITIADSHGSGTNLSYDELCAMAQKESTQILNKVLRSASEQMKNGFSFADTCVNK